MLKKITAVVAAGALGLFSISGAALARQAHVPAAPSAYTQADSALERALALGDSLSMDQKAALMDAAEGWRALGSDALIMEQAKIDVARILTPAQAREFWNVVQGVNEGGVYLPIMCLFSSSLGVLFSMVGVIGCTNETSIQAFLDAFAAFIYANECLISGATSCDEASYAAGLSASGWSTLIDSCDVADTAYYSTALAYATCGGTW